MTDKMRKLEYLLNELESNQLQVCLAPSKRKLNEHDQIRVALSRNCSWYRRFCSQHISKRATRRGKPDTLIRRQHTLKALNRLLSGKPRNTIYEQRILAILPGVKLTA